MLKYLISAVMLLAFAVASASAAPQPDPLAGKIVAIDGAKVQVSFAGEKPAWIKKGAVVKVANEAGEAVDNVAKVMEVSEGSFSVSTKKAADLKVGDSLSFQKGRATTGC